MKVEIERAVTTRETVEVDLPYYYRYDCPGYDFESVYYGKIDEHATTVICIRSSRATGVSAEVTRDNCHPGSNACYFAEEYKGSAADYLAARQVAAELIANA